MGKKDDKQKRGLVAPQLGPMVPRERLRTQWEALDLAGRI